MKNYLLIALLLFSIVAFAQEGASAYGAAALEKAIQNPMASLISLPFQNNIDFGVEDDDSTKNDGGRFRAFNIYSFCRLNLLGIHSRYCGNVLSAPLTMACKIVFEQNKKTKWMAVFLGNDEDAKRAQNENT